MKILMLPSIFGGVSWWRFTMPAKALKATGMEVTCLTLDDAEVAMRAEGGFYSWLDKEAEKYDIIHTGYTGQIDVATNLFKIRDKHKIPIIVDIDDDLDNVPTYNPGWKSFHPGTTGNKIIKTQLKYADAITFSTLPLSSNLNYLLQDKVSKVLENWVDIDSWDFPTPEERSKDQSIRLMITGGNGRYGDWAILKEPLEWAMKKFDGTDGKPMLRLFFIGGTPDWVLPWMQNKENPNANRCFYIQPSKDVLLFNKIVRYIGPDIILSPTQKNEFNRCKSGLKFLESALAGAIFICTDFDTYSNAPEGTCLKVDNTFTQWQAALEEAITNKELRQRLADKAKSYVLDYCDAKDHITPRLEFYQSVLEDYKCRMSQPVVQGQEATLVPDKP